MPSPARPAGTLFSPNDPVEFDWLFLDLNSYFASVEQQTRPELRGRPVAVVPVETDHTCAIAASYEAKAFGVKTGTMIHEAKRKCPGIVCVLAGHRKYVEWHHKVLAEIERHVPVEKVMSVDEVACRLYGDWRTPAGAVALAKRIKAGIARHVGECLTSSIGISTNRFLAKVASDMQKPDGLVTLHPTELPGRFAHLELHDLPGIGRNMERRLWAARIDTLTQLWHCPAKQLRAVWGGVEGERFWHRLRGLELPEEPTQRGMIGHSHVLEPAFRPADQAGLVARRLLLKAAVRLRREGLWATRLSLSARVEGVYRGEPGPRIEVGGRFSPSCDSQTLLQALVRLWDEVLQQAGAVRFKKVSLNLHGLVTPEDMRQLDLFAPKEAATRGQEAVRLRRERLSAAMDAIVKKLGRDAVTLGVMPGSVRNFTGAKVAFNRVPDARDFEELVDSPAAVPQAAAADGQDES